MIKLFDKMIKIHQLFAIIFLLLIPGKNLANCRASQIKCYPKNTLYFGSFKQIADVNFCVLYDGEIIKLQDGCFTIKDTMLGFVHILFADPEKINFKTEGNNTVLSLSLETKDYKYYQLELVQLPVINTLPDGTVVNDFAISWNICEKKIDTHIPFNTIVIPLDPKNLEIKLQSITGKPNNLAIKLPQIELIAKNSSTLKELMIEGYLKVLNLAPFHSKQQIKFNLKNGTKISMIL